MSNVEDTIGMGLSKIQDGLDKSKNKVGSMKEISKLNKTIEDISAKKAEVLLEVGMNVYKKVREGIIKDEEIIEKCKNIVGFDYIIYDNKIKIEELKKVNEGFTCSCGKTLTYEDKFCGGCGNKVEIPVENIEYVTCNNCEMNINSDLNFCPCCGIKIN